MLLLSYIPWAKDPSRPPVETDVSQISIRCGTERLSKNFLIHHRQNKQPRGIKNKNFINRAFRIILSIDDLSMTLTKILHSLDSTVEQKSRTSTSIDSESLENQLSARQW